MIRLIRNPRPLAALNSGTVATIGNFDGLHRGHQALLKHLRTHANRMQLPLFVLLFEPQPGEYFQGHQAPARLSTLREKISLLKQFGVDYVYCLKFNSAIASMPPGEFAEKIIFLLMNARYLLVGQDFHFGCNRSGDITFLRQFSERHGCEVGVFDDFLIDHERVSSTRIRKALQMNALDEAAQLLGYRYRMCGRVVKGEGRGGQWGIPTANLNIHRHSLPLRGVFCVQVTRENGSKELGVANLGYRPTVGGNKAVLEVHLFAFNGTLYGEHLQVEFLKKLRDEIKFSSFNALIEQIRNDIVQAQTFLGLKNQSVCF